jgi:hypothetical protein
MFMHKNDYFTQRNYIIAEGIEHEGLKEFLSEIQYYTNQCARYAARNSERKEQP